MNTSNKLLDKSSSILYQTQISQLEGENLQYNQLPQLEPSKCSNKQIGLISAYGANTHQGLVRNYNEDRVSIILNMMKPQNKQELKYWPTCSFFAIYDGHGGQNCAEFLRDNLHYFIIRDENFPSNVREAINRGFEKAEKQWVEKADSGTNLDKSGSCAVCILLVDSICYVANLGDSRALLSRDGGQKVQVLTKDHKPNDPDEEKRIVQLGGKIYQSQIQVQNNLTQRPGVQIIKGPYRVLPGRLAVSRTMGDSEAKLSKYGGIHNVVSAIPDVICFNLDEDIDFLLLGCDGIFDKLTNQEVVEYCWQLSKSQKNVHDFVGRSIENIMRQSLMRRSYDNVTVVIIGLQNLDNYFKKLAQRPQSSYKNDIQLQNSNKSKQY